MSNKVVTHKGSCHCGAVQFEVHAPENLIVSQCNCSICNKSGYQGFSVPKEMFKLLQGEGDLSCYTFNAGTAKHYFCKHCGIKSFYIPRSHPDGYSINMNCLDGSTIKEVTTKPSNGREWEKVFPNGRADDYPNFPDTEYPI